jgi:hypothetical protein
MEQRARKVKRISAILDNELVANTVFFEQLEIVATATRINDIMTMLRLHAGQIYRNVSVAVTVIAMINEMNNSHVDQFTCKSGKFYRDLYLLR